MRVSPLSACFTAYSHRQAANNVAGRALLTHAKRMMSLSSSLTTTDSTREDDTHDNKMKLQLVDVDCNLLHKDLISIMDSSSFKFDDVPTELKILHHPSTRSIQAIISPSSTVAESEKSVHLIQSSTDKQRNNIIIKTTVGVHPYNTQEDALTSANVDKLRALLSKSNNAISCIGETGLDYSEGFPNKQYQLPWFQKQLDLAFEYGLPLFVHERLAFQDTLQCIDEANNRHVGQATPKIIIHCFTGSFDECVEYMRRGYYMSVSGYILKDGNGSDEVRKCLTEGIIPLDRLMIETDAPYMGFATNKETFFEAEGDAFTSLSSKKKKRLKSLYPNVPSALPVVLEATCNAINIGRKQRGEEIISVEELAISTTKTACDFFQIGD